MPNWCNNSVTISGPTETIRRVWENTTNSENDQSLLQAMAPMPDELVGTKAPDENAKNWYSWRVNNWNTKWDVSDEGLEFTDNGDGTATIEGWFDSAWSPPVGAYEQFLKNTNDCSVEASYYESGLDFGGFWENGNDIHFDDLQEQLDQPTELWTQDFVRFEGEYDLLSEEWRFEETDIEME